MLTVTPRQAVGTLGVLLFLAGFIALMIPMSETYDTEVFGDMTVKCGSTFNVRTEYMSGKALAACEDTIGTRRAWAWPLLAVGVVVVVGAVVVHTPSRRPTE